MTQINVISPSELSRQHLIAEYRELPRIYGLVSAAIARGERPNDPRNPETYTLGKGHCRFFYSRLHWLTVRHTLICGVMVWKGYQVNHLPRWQWDLPNIPPEWWNDWTPTIEAITINRQRILERTT